MRPIFLDDADYRTFLAMLSRAVRGHRWDCLTFCLMPNHYHLVLAPRDGDVSAGMKALNGGYARHFNKRHGCEGHLFRNRFRSVEVARDEHLYEVCRYVVLNPVRAGLCRSAEDWPWSSHRASAGLDWSPPFLADRMLLRFFGASPSVARRRYREFVAAGASRVSDTVTRV